MDNQVEMHVDPLCPWCWLTALWLFEVERVRPIAITTKLFSLAEINSAHAKADHAAALKAGEDALRVMAAARRAGGERAIRATYTALGEANHERSENLGAREVLRAAVSSAGLSADLADEAVADPSTLHELRAEHAAAVERGAFGVPTLSIDGGAAFFGPIVDTRITGEDAGQLWDKVGPVLSEPRLFELKRTRTGHPEVGRHRRTVAAVH